MEEVQALFGLQLIVVFFAHTSEDRLAEVLVLYSSC